MTIENNGDVYHTGQLVRLKNVHLTSAEIAALKHVATAIRFSTLPALTRCPRARASATTWVQVGPRKVEVQGSCLARYQRLLAALKAAVHISTSG